MLQLQKIQMQKANGRFGRKRKSETGATNLVSLVRKRAFGTEQEGSLPAMRKNYFVMIGVLDS